MSLRNRKSVYCPKCQAHTEQERGAKRGERYCGTCGETFTLDASRKAEKAASHAPDCICVNCEDKQ